jgi:hypothetical protein
MLVRGTSKHFVDGATELPGVKLDGKRIVVCTKYPASLGTDGTHWVEFLLEAADAMALGRALMNAGASVSGGASSYYEKLIASLQAQHAAELERMAVIRRSEQDAERARHAEYVKAVR